MSRSLIVLPDATAAPIVAAIDAARKSLRVKMFVLSDPGLIGALTAARGRGVDVRVMLNPARRNGETENEASRKALEAARITVAESNPDFELTHEKSMVVDDAEAFVMSLNWETRNVTKTRDYAVVTRHAAEVAEVRAGFDADWERKPFAPAADSSLIWCSNNGRERFAHFIDRARHTLVLQNERYQDAVIIERVVRALRRGVKVHILARPPHTLKKDKLIEGVGGLRIMQDVGAKVHKLKGLRLHGKMMLADDERAIIGSVNLAPGSFDGRRELAIEVDDRHVISELTRVAEHDWRHSEALDLTDEGLLADLAKRGEEGGAADLVLDAGSDGHDRQSKHDKHSKHDRKA
jgi:phosphatidylserine/phosphatidylglycerophosphate/cardiolipin synthase-like enzyme